MIKRRAFSLAEVCLALAILALAGGLAMPLGLGAYRIYALRTEAAFVANLLRRARGQAINNIGQLPHGLHFEAKRYVLFTGAVWDQRNLQADAVFPASPGIAVAAPGDIIFLQLSGSPKNAGNINFSGTGGQLIISVNEAGQINFP